MKVFFNGWFSGFIDKTNPGLHVGFFIDLFEKVYMQPCEIGTFENSEILCEFDMLLDTNGSKVNNKQWLQSYLFSGESTLKCKKSNYTCVLWGERNHSNTINVPLYIPYLYSNNLNELINESKTISHFPSKEVCVIISNNNGAVRNKFLDKLEKFMDIDYAGNYKNNIGGHLKPNYNTSEYREFLGKYKFVITMENSREDTYITEKLINGVMSVTIPVYWGSNKVFDYINKDRFLNLENDSEKDMLRIIGKMKNLSNNQSEWLEMVNKEKLIKGSRTFDDIVIDIKCLINKQNCWNHISKVYCINNPDFEHDRYIHLQNLFSSCNISNDFIKYISPTYKHLITEAIYNKHINNQLVRNLRTKPPIMKKGELSLFLNYKAVLEDIVKNYKDGIFLIFESDIFLGKDVYKLNDFIDNIKNEKWDIIHLGIHSENTFNDPALFFNIHDDINKTNNLKNFISKNRVVNQKYIEDIVNTKFRVSRKFYTRCCDSFLWKYDGIKKFLHYMNNETNYGVPFDYYMSNFFETDLNFKHYWSENEFFKQGSNLGLLETTLQNDKE